MPRRPSIERRVARLVSDARRVVGEYGDRPINNEELRRLQEAHHISHSTARLSVPALLFPPVGGFYRLVFQEHLPVRVQRFLILHELAHILAGEADEPMQMKFAGPLPENEDVCDLFALLGVVPAEHIVEGGSWLEERIRELVPLEDRGWQLYRIARLAKRLPRVREKVVRYSYL